MSGYANIDGNYSPTVRWIPGGISGSGAGFIWNSSVGTGSVGLKGGSVNSTPTTIGGKTAVYINPSTGTDHSRKIALKLDPTATYLGSGGITTVCVVQDFGGDPTANSFSRFINWLDSTPNTGIDNSGTANVGLLIRNSSDYFETSYNSVSLAHSYSSIYSSIGSTPTLIVAKYDHTLQKLKIWFNREFNFRQTEISINLGSLSIQHIGLGYVPDSTSNTLRALGKLKVSEVMFWNSALTDLQIRNLSQDILVEYGIRTPITHTPAYNTINTTYSPNIWWQHEDIGGENPQVQWFSIIGNGQMRASGSAANVFSNYLAGKPSCRINAFSNTTITKYITLDTNLLRTNQSFTIAFILSDFNSFGIGNSPFIQLLNTFNGTGGLSSEARLLYTISNTNLSLNHTSGNSYFSPALVPDTVGTGTIPVLFVFRYTLGTGLRIYYNTLTDSIRVDDNRDLSVLNWRYIRFGGNSGSNCTALSVSEVILWDRALNDTEITDFSQTMLVEYAVRPNITTPVSSGPIIINPITSNAQFKGTWISGTYNQNDIVYYKNTELFYKCNQTTTTEEPAMGSHWDFIAQNVIRTNSNQLIGAARTNIFSGTNLLVNTTFNSATVTGYIPPVTVVPAAVTLPFTVEEISSGTNYKLVLGSYGTPVPTQQNYTATITFDSTGGNFTQDVQFTVDNRPEFVGLMVTTKNLGFVNKNAAFTSPSPVIILGTELELNGETITSIDFELHNGTGLVSTPPGMQINTSTLNLEIPSMALAEDTYYIKKIVVTDEENETAIFSPEIYVQFTYADLPTSAPTLAGDQVQYWNSYTITDGSSTFTSLNVLDFDTSYVLTRINENNYIVENITVDYVNKMNISSGFGILDIDTYDTNYTLDSLITSSYIFEDVDGLEMQNVNTGSYIIKFTVKFSAFEGATNLNVDTWNIDFYATFSVKSEKYNDISVGYSGIGSTMANQVSVNISNLFSQGLSESQIQQKIVDLVTESDAYDVLSQDQKDRILPVISKISAIFSESNGIAFRSISSSSNTSTGININLIR